MRRARTWPGEGRAPNAHRKEARAYSLPPSPRGIASRICPDLISDRHKAVSQISNRWRSSGAHSEPHNNRHIDLCGGWQLKPPVGSVTWMIQRAQVRAALTARDRTVRQKLYKKFIEEASKLYGDALMHSAVDVPMLIGAYALINRMRIISPSDSDLTDRASFTADQSPKIRPTSPLVSPSGRDDLPPMPSNHSIETSQKSKKKRDGRIHECRIWDDDDLEVLCVRKLCFAK
jgi:hypothetical protein